MAKAHKPLVEKYLRGSKASVKVRIRFIRYLVQGISGHCSVYCTLSLPSTEEPAFTTTRRIGGPL